MGLKLGVVGGFGGSTTWLVGMGPQHGGQGQGHTPTSMLELKARFTLALMLTTCPTLKNTKRRKRVGLLGFSRHRVAPSEVPRHSSSLPTVVRLPGTVEHARWLAEHGDSHS